MKVDRIGLNVEYLTGLNSNNNSEFDTKESHRHIMIGVIMFLLTDEKLIQHLIC